MDAASVILKTTVLYNIPAAAALTSDLPVGTSARVMNYPTEISEFCVCVFIYFFNTLTSTRFNLAACRYVQNQNLTGDSNLSFIVARQNVRLSGLFACN